MIYKFKNHTLNFSENNIYIMGILNCTPDSFSDGGRYLNLDKALFRAEEMERDGATIIDVGGESTRPFSEPISVEDELDRVIPVIEKINKNINCIISVDTYKSIVAKEACKNGAEIINDISGFSYDNNIVEIAKEYNTGCIVMHMKGNPKNMQIDPQYDDILEDISRFFKKQTSILMNAGLNKIIIDVGFGFGKTLDDNYFLLNNLNFLKRFNLPICAGISKKSMIGNVIDGVPDERTAATIALNTISVLNGAKILRVHDVKENHQAIKVIKKSLEFI